MAAYLNVQQTLLANKLTMNAGIRYDYNEHSGGWVDPASGDWVIPAATTVLKAIAKGDHRNPTIREMYMFPPQNPICCRTIDELRIVAVEKYAWNPECGVNLFTRWAIIWYKLSFTMETTEYQYRKSEKFGNGIQCDL